MHKGYDAQEASHLFDANDMLLEARLLSLTQSKEKSRKGTECSAVEFGTFVC